MTGEYRELTGEYRELTGEGPELTVRGVRMHKVQEDMVCVECYIFFHFPPPFTFRTHMMRKRNEFVAILLTIQ